MAYPKYYHARGDSEPVLMQLFRNGAPEILTGCLIAISMWQSRDHRTLLVNGDPVAIIDAATGRVSYTFSVTANSLPIGVYDCRLTVTYPSTQVKTFPTNVTGKEYFGIQIV